MVFDLSANGSCGEISGKIDESDRLEQANSDTMILRVLEVPPMIFIKSRKEKRHFSFYAMVC